MVRTRTSWSYWRAHPVSSFDEHGLSLFLVDANAQGVSKVLYPMMDAQRVANITFDNVQLGADALLGDAGSALDVVNEVIRDALLALASEAVGIMGTLNAKTLEYTKTREQFRCGDWLFSSAATPHGRYHDGVRAVEIITV
jgi:alkylation response protein AidB-like acyl-CoA dehydrogenase